MMNKVNRMFLLFLALTILGLFLALFVYSLLGFPSASQPTSDMLWWKLTLLIIILAIPFGVRISNRNSKPQTKQK